MKNYAPSQCIKYVSFLLYILGMLEDSDVTSTVEDLYEAIGPFLEQVDDTRTEDEIKEICDRLYALISKE